MLKKSLFLLALAVFAASVAAYAAPSRAGKTDIGLNVSAAIPDDEDLDTAPYIGGTISYGITDIFAIGFSGGWAEYEDEGFGDLSGVPLLGELIIRVPMDSPVQPYGVVGLGAIVWDYQETSFTTSVLGLDLDIDTSFAVKLGGGLDWFINDHWILYGEGSYLISDADGQFKNAATGATVATFEDIETDAWFVGGGFKYVF